MGKIDAKKLKSQLTLAHYEAIFKALEIPIHSKGKAYWTLYTGCHNRNAYSGSPKLLFYLDTKMLQCLTQCACTMDILGLVQRRLGLLGQEATFVEAMTFIIETTGIEAEAVERINTHKHSSNWEESLGKYIRVRRQGSNLPSYDKNILYQLTKSYPLDWLNEGISVDSLQKYQIGYYPRLNQTTIPCFNRDGSLCGIRVRNWQPERIEAAKYMPLITLDNTCYKFDTNALLYGLNYNWAEIERTGTVYIVESEKAVLKADTWFGNQSCFVGMFGGNLGLKRRNELLKLGVKRVVYVADNDFEPDNQAQLEVWQNKIMKFVNLWKGFAQVELVWDNLGLLKPKDNAMDSSFETWQELYDNREVFINS